MSANLQKPAQPELTVACTRCGGHAGKIVDGVLIYTVKHSGEHHTVRINLAWLEKVLIATK